MAGANETDLRTAYDRMTSSEQSRFIEQRQDAARTNRAIATRALLHKVFTTAKSNLGRQRLRRVALG